MVGSEPRISAYMALPSMFARGVTKREVQHIYRCDQSESLTKTATTAHPGLVQTPSGRTLITGSRKARPASKYIWQLLTKHVSCELDNANLRCHSPVN